MAPFAKKDLVVRLSEVYCKVELRSRTYAYLSDLRLAESEMSREGRLSSCSSWRGMKLVLGDEGCCCCPSPPVVSTSGLITTSGLKSSARERRRSIVDSTTEYRRRLHFNLDSDKSPFSFLRTLTTWHCPHSPTARRCCWAPAVQQSIDISCPLGPQQQTYSMFFTF